MQIKLKSLHLENFKGIKLQDVVFGDKTKIKGRNAAGKTTLFDAFTWLLFNKNSAGDEKFNVRPLDEDGKRVDNVEIKVIAVLDVDGREVEISKVQKQKWVKKRSSSVAELQGNENLFEINGYPKSEKDYKEYISDLVNEDLFKLITNPQAFTSLPWKKQREVLMKLVDDVSDVDIANSNNMFLELVPELEQASTDDIRKKYTKALNEWKKRQDVIPELINELSKQIKDIDVAEMEIQRNILKQQIAETEKLQEDSMSAMEEQDKAFNEVIRIKGEMRDISTKAETALSESRKSIQKRKDEAQRGFDDSRQKIRMCELDISRCKQNIERYEADKKHFQDEYTAEREKTFPVYVELPAMDENSLICPTCGQDLPEELRKEKISGYEQDKAAHRKDYEEKKLAFEESKKNRIAEITKNGNATVAAIKEKQEELKRLEADLEQAKKDSIRFNKEESEEMEELAKLPLYPDMSENQEYEALELELLKANELLNSLSTGADYRNQLKIKLAGLREELADVQKKIDSSDNTEVEERIEELQNEQRDVGQRVADMEKMLYLLESFIRAKMMKISDSINQHFKTVNFKLFDMQLNGGMKECCECTVCGVPYSTLNSGHRIIAGLDIIRSLSELYGVTAPIFIDNAESLNEFNVPDMAAQMILLAVSDDKELKVEVE